MKKWIPAVLCSAILVLTLPASVIAENGNNSTTESITSAKSSASGETTTTTSKINDFNFSFTSNGDSITVTWNAKGNPGIEVKSVKLDSENYTVNDSTGIFNVPVSKPGIYTLTYILNNGQIIPAGEKVERGGNLTTVLSVKITNGRIEATVKDNFGRPVAEYPIRLYINGTEVAGGKTNSNGVFSSMAPSNYSEILCVAENRSVGSINYTGDQKSISSIGGSTTGKQITTASKANTTSLAATTKAEEDNGKTKAETTAATYAVINGAGTTSVVGDNIAVNFSFDTQVAKNFNYSNTEFEARARLLLSKDTYTSLVGQSNATLMLLAKTPASVVTPQFISTAINGKSNYSSFNPDETESIPLDLSLAFIDAAHNVYTPVFMPTTEVTIELPIPKSMSDKSKYKIVAAIYDDNGIKKLIDADVKDGSIQFKTDHLTNIAILGFKSPTDLDKKGGGIPSQPVIMIIIGVILLGGAITLLYFFFLRKPHPAAESGLGEAETGYDRYSDRIDPSFEPKLDNEQIAEYPEDNGIDIYSGPVKKQIKQEKQENEHPAPGVSLGSIAKPSQEKNKKKNPSDYDIDL